MMDSARAPEKPEACPQALAAHTLLIQLLPKHDPDVFQSLDAPRHHFQLLILVVYGHLLSRVDQRLEKMRVPQPYPTTPLQAPQPCWLACCCRYGEDSDFWAAGSTRVGL